MIYISAQPATKYFQWQLEIQLRNFQALGIKKENIHVLVAVDVKNGLSSSFQRFIEEHENYALFFIYPDRRILPRYSSTVRPHILKQHFEKLDQLKFERIFYHDSDILFSRVPKIEDDEICYVSDTRNYLDLNYLRSVADEKLIDDMLSLVGISKEVLLKNDCHTGGAQYVLNNIDASFWEKVEKDAESLYILMRDYNERLWQEHYAIKKEYRSKRRGIQAWCSDMWTVLWNLWYFEKEVRISNEMDFSWPTSSIEQWDEKAIQHYSGNVEENRLYFKKTDYLNFAPWYDEGLLEIPDTNCSFRIVELIKQRKIELEDRRKSYSNDMIVLCLTDMDEMEKAVINRRYILKHLHINVAFKVDNEILDFEGNQLGLFSKMRTYQNIIVIPAKCLIEVDAISAFLGLSEEKHVSQYKINESYKIDNLFFETFSKVLDFELLKGNTGKMNVNIISQDQIGVFKQYSLNDILEKYDLNNMHESYFQEFSNESFNL